MFRRFLPALLCLVAIMTVGGAARAQAPALTVLNLAEHSVVVRDLVTFRLGPAAGTTPAGKCADWLPALEAQAWQLFVQGTPTPASVGGVALECEGTTVVRATVRLLYHGLPDTLLKQVERPIDNIWAAFDGQFLRVDVGPAAQPIGPAQTLWVKSTATWQRALVVATLLAGIGGFFLMVFGTNIARDPMPPASIVNGVPCPDGCRPAFSLSRMQFLWWLFIVTMCFMVIVTLTGRTDTISNDTLVLLGIVGGTSLLAVTQDQRKAPDENVKRANLAADYQQIAAAAAPAPAAPAADGAAPASAVPVNVAPAAALTLSELEHDVHNASRNFFDDLLTDANGLSVHRLQMLIWTVVLGMVFLVKTMRTMGMPDLDDNLLVLMGISSGTYFGFKINETQVPPAQTGAQPANA
ncbi:MAG TPA: hypothetical protein VD860_01760 [Azospirillum sp.]|nr:hypothetical protein [Azospirillum sp.]